MPGPEMQEKEPEVKSEKKVDPKAQNEEVKQQPKENEVVQPPKAEEKEIINKEPEQAPDFDKLMSKPAPKQLTKEELKAQEQERKAAEKEKKAKEKEAAKQKKAEEKAAAKQKKAEEKAAAKQKKAEEKEKAKKAKEAREKKKFDKAMERAEDGYEPKKPFAAGLRRLFNSKSVQKYDQIKEAYDKADPRLKVKPIKMPDRPGLIGTIFHPFNAAKYRKMDKMLGLKRPHIGHRILDGIKKFWGGRDEKCAKYEQKFEKKLNEYNKKKLAERDQLRRENQAKRGKLPKQQQKMPETLKNKIEAQKQQQNPQVQQPQAPQSAVEKQMSQMLKMMEMQNQQINRLMEQNQMLMQQIVQKNQPQAPQAQQPAPQAQPEAQPSQPQAEQQQPNVQAQPEAQPQVNQPQQVEQPVENKVEQPVENKVEQPVENKVEEPKDIKVDEPIEVKDEVNEKKPIEASEETKQSSQQRKEEGKQPKSVEDLIAKAEQKYGKENLTDTMRKNLTELALGADQAAENVKNAAEKKPNGFGDPKARVDMGKIIAKNLIEQRMDAGLDVLNDLQHTNMAQEMQKAAAKTNTAKYLANNITAKSRLNTLNRPESMKNVTKVAGEQIDKALSEGYARGANEPKNLDVKLPEGAQRVGNMNYRMPGDMMLRTIDGANAQNAAKERAEINSNITNGIDPKKPVKKPDEPAVTNAQPKKNMVKKNQQQSMVKS